MTVPDAYDTPWKDILEGYLPEFMAFFFPDIYAAIDWSRGYTFLDKELQSVTRDAEIGLRLADKLVQVWRKDGTDAWLLIHIEIQGQEESVFAKRMFVYHYRLFDRYQRPIVSLAVLSDDRATWRPHEFGYSQWGCGIRFWFPIIKIVDYKEQQAELAASANPFATVVLTHLAARATRQDAPTRAQVKYQLTRQLYARGYNRQMILDLYRFIDWLLHLPDELDKQVWQQIKAYEEAQQMKYISTAERIGMAQGRAEGLAEGRAEAARDLARRLAEKRFGPLDEELMALIAALPVERLDDFVLAILDFTHRDELRAWLEAPPIA